MIVAINYANAKYRQTQKFNSATAIRKGRVDKVISYSPKDVDREFRRKNKRILSQERGNGYWLWKPYFIWKTLKNLQDNDYLVYLDSGAFYRKDVRYLIRAMEADGQDIMVFELPFKEFRYTKRDVFVCMDCDEPEYTNTNQRMATMVIIKKTKDTLAFVQEWLDYGQADNIITDEKNHLGKDNYEGFIDNRHDQSIFSLLSKKYKLKAYRDPSQFGRFPDIIWRAMTEKLEESEKCSKYPQIIARNGKPEVTRRVLIDQWLLACAPRGIVDWYVHSKFYTGAKGSSGKIALLTDNMPIKENAYGYGMYKVVHRLIKALGNRVETVICTDKNYSKDKVEYAVWDKIVLANKFHDRKPSSFENVYFLAEMFGIVCDLRYQKINKIFIPLGADYRELKRAYLLSIFYRISVSIYIVDDFVEYDRIFAGDQKHGPGFEKCIIRYLKRMHQIYVISEGMRDRVYRLTGRKAVILPLPYEWKELPATDRNADRQIMFIGSISNLYIQGLQDIAAVIDQMNMQTDRPIRLLFTYCTTADVRKIIGNYQCIHAKRLETEQELRVEMRNSLFCFMPYSNKANLQIMQNTSFPSKLTEYMSAARSIVIYGNSRNSAQRYFEENKLPQVIEGRNKELLRQCIIEHLEGDIDHSKKYVQVLRKNHALSKIEKRILRYL